MDDAVGYFYGVFNYEFSVVRFYYTTIADLAARFGIEAGFIKNQVGLCAGFDAALVLEAALVKPADYFALAAIGMIFMNIFLPGCKTLKHSAQTFEISFFQVS